MLKPTSYLSFLIGHEAPGTLTQILKAKGGFSCYVYFHFEMSADSLDAIIRLAAGVDYQTMSDFALFYIDMELTNHGIGTFQIIFNEL